MASALPSPGRRLRFGQFEFALGGRELWRDGQPVRLQEQPAQILAALLERPGEVLTRDDLRQRLWPADTFVDFEHGLNTAIKKVRQALGDSAETPQYVETLARRGYRFIAPIELVTDPPLAAVARARARGVWWAIAVVILILAAAWFARRGGVPAGRPPAAAELAVLPFRVIAEFTAGDRSDIGVGIADAIITRLASVRQFSLRSTPAVLPFKDDASQADSELAKIASALSVQHLLVGTIQPTPEMYRLTVQLVRADGVVEWARKYDEPRAGLLHVQDQIADHVVSALRVALSPPERARLHARYSENPAAYDLYLRGRAQFVNYTEAGMREAIASFEQALAIDPNYALARAGLATAVAWFSVRYAYVQDALAWGQRADEQARAALAQDPSLADAHLAIGSAAGTLYGGFNWTVVLDRSAAALALDPMLDLAHVVRMRAFYHLGLFDRVAEEARLARAINPTPNVETERLEVAAYLFSGQFEAALARAPALLGPTDAPAVRHYLGLARYYTGDVAAAKTMLASAQRAGQLDVRSQASLASIEAASGLRREGRARAEGIAAGAYMDHHVAYSLGATFAQLGEPDTAVLWLERAADTGFPCAPWFERDPLLAPLRQHPRFVKLYERVRGAYEQARARVR